MTILLMAAGSGSRYGKLKQFDELGPTGEFLMEFGIYDALEQGFDHVVVITKAQNQSFLQDYLGERLPKSVKLDVLVQDIKDLPEGQTVETAREKPWGTAHAVWTARHVIDESFVIVNADDYYGKAAFSAAADFMKTQANDKHYGLIGYELANTLSDHGTVSRGVCKTEHGKLKTIQEHLKIQRDGEMITDLDTGNDLEPDTTVSMNFWICSPSIFPFIEDYFKAFIAEPSNLEKNEMYLPFVIHDMMQDHLVTVHVLEANSQWFGVTYYADKTIAVEALDALSKDGKYPVPLWRQS